MRCETCGTDGAENAMGKFVSNDWLRCQELTAEISRLQAENKRLQEEIKTHTDKALGILADLKDQLRTAEQRVARDCCEIVEARRVESCCEEDDCYNIAIENVLLDIKAKYGL